MTDVLLLFWFFDELELAGHALKIKTEVDGILAGNATTDYSQSYPSTMQFNSLLLPRKSASILLGKNHWTGRANGFHGLIGLLMWKIFCLYLGYGLLLLR